ncbi:coiled-coil domain-containing protein 80 isoform X2 [Lingula anatina]|uniref:Coiled-coil domain-containing protein 80 isoform X1 n=1 Tax=Lingula anatina TaxID=7574 RepID=A0A1S3JKA6_LINAN|nr:coiled-coil domain-containing protein 80 isoform X1 [Lingula anatina]XP_013410803.1 coiled-coil domain-containing protein 80 isoform X2 [Lingula anatina]|eukprot:XP_013410802.1 coiled-coil domain-containing protein 80 isoform X1 [Lingula anatina]
MYKLGFVVFALVLFGKWDSAYCWFRVRSHVCLPTFRWQSRVLVIASPSMGDQAYQQQSREIKSNVCEMSLRDMAVIAIFNVRDVDRSKVTWMVYQQHFGVPRTRKLNHREAHRIVDCLGLEKDRFNMVLVGADGYKKRTYRYPTSMATIFRLIDTMPMRRREIQEQARDGIYCY